MLLGYARVSTTDQELALQLDALTQAGCERTFTDKASGACADRPGLRDALAFARGGDVLVVWKLDRVGRSVKHLVEFVSQLQAKDIGFKSLTESIDTTSPTGTFFFHVMAAMAQMERDLIRERTQAGLKAARARGRKGGRPRKLNSERLAFARQMLSEGKQATQVARLLGVDRSTLYRRLRACDDSNPSPPQS